MSSEDFVLSLMGNVGSAFFKQEAGYTFVVVMKGQPGQHLSHTAPAVTIRDGFVFLPSEERQWCAFNLSEVKSISRVKV